MADLIAETERLFAAVTHKLNDLIAFRRLHDPTFTDPDLVARQRRLERIRRRLFARWVRRDGAALLTEADYAAYDD